MGEKLFDGCLKEEKKGRRESNNVRDRRAEIVATTGNNFA